METPSKQGSTHQQQEPLKLPVSPQLVLALAPTLALTTTRVSTTSSSYYTGTCSWPHSKCVHTTGQGHHPCLPCSLTTRSGRATEDTNSPCSHCRLLAVLAKDYRVVDAADLRGLSWRDIKRPQSSVTTSSCTWHLVSPDPGSQHTPACYYPLKVFSH